jgi:hypothetical protein
VATKSAKMSSKGSVISENLNYMSLNSKEFKDLDNEENQRERSISKNSVGNNDDEDEFFDANDVFD